MNDVLPKPFTKEGLLTMLEKHLAHLKKGHPGASLEGPPSLPTGVSSVSVGGGAPLAQQPKPASSRQSLKDETSPGASPATVSTNWNSPMQPAGMSPVANNAMSPDEYMNAVNSGRVPYPAYQGMENQMGAVPVPGAPGQFATPRAPQAGAQRRGIDQISGGPMVNGDVKRQQTYAQVPPMGQPRP